LANTLSERHKLDSKKLDELMGDFEKAFAAVTGKAGQGQEPEDTRRLIAHLLFCTSQDDQARQRAAVVVGLKAFTHEVNSRAHALQQMAHYLQADMVADRSQFDREQRRILGELELLARDLDERKEELDRRQTLVNRHNALLKAREADIVELKKQIDTAGEATKTALTELAKEQGRLFGVQSRVGEDLQKNLRLEQEMRTIENAR
jgi:chromosome segregation ATPase